MVSELELKSTGLMELWGLGFIATAVALIACGADYGFHLKPAWNARTMPVVVICYVSYGLLGMFCAIVVPSFDPFARNVAPVSMKSRVIFSMIHVGLSTIACAAFSFV